MSVINQMLRDLDARDASAQERANLPPRLRPLPPTARVERRHFGMLGLGLGAGILLTLIAVSLMRGTSSAVPPAPTFSPPPAAVAPPPSLPPATDAGEMQLSTLIGQAPPAKPDTPPAPPPPTNVTSRPKPAEPVATKPVPTVSPGRPTTVTAAPPAVPAAQKPPQSPPPVSGEEAQINKYSKGDTAKEMAGTEYRKAMQAANGGDNDAALALFRHTLELDPAFVKARQGYLSVLVATHRWDEARQVAEQGLALDPTQSSWAVILARLQFEQGDSTAAVATLERFAAHAPRDADYQGLFAYLLQKQQRPAEATTRFRAALQTRPNEGRWWFGLGLALEQTDQPAEARAAYARARETGNLPADMVALVEQKLK